VAGPWVVVPSPNPSSSANYLTSVSALSESDVWAVGGFEDTNFRLMTLIEHWDGATWSVVPSPNPSATGDYLGGVLALAQNNVWAVGNYVHGSVQASLVELEWKKVDEGSEPQCQRLRYLNSTHRHQCSVG
jgi:hypothetical protein